MARHKHIELKEDEVRCPRCNNGPVTQVIVYDPYCDDEPEEGHRRQLRKYGLAFANKDGKVCCSFNEGWYRTREQAEEYIKSRSFHDHCVDQDMSWVDDQEDIIGDQDPCGDPYPEIPEY